MPLFGDKLISKEDRKDLKDYITAFGPFVLVMGMMLSPGFFCQRRQIIESYDVRTWYNSRIEVRYKPNCDVVDYKQDGTIDEIQYMSGIRLNGDSKNDKRFTNMPTQLSPELRQWYADFYERNKDKVVWK